MSRAWIGTSGWNYDKWKEDFYAGVPRSGWLRHCSEKFTAIEVNATFYRQQTKSTFEKWRTTVPEDFVFAVKGNRYLTHSKKLLDPEEPIRRERERATTLGPKLGAVLWQVPPNLGKDLPRLREFAEALRSRWPTRHTIEFRDRSWFDDEVAACLRRHEIAVCISDAADWPMWEEITADFVYVRLHGHTRTYASAYSGPNLDRWAERVHGWMRSGRDVHVYFDNDSEGAAPRDALRLRERVEG